LYGLLNLFYRFVFLGFLRLVLNPVYVYFLVVDTVLRSPHIDKKSREQFEIRTHNRLIDIFDANPRTVEALNRLVVPAGVFVKKGVKTGFQNVQNCNTINRSMS